MRQRGIQQEVWLYSSRFFIVGVVLTAGETDDVMDMDNPGPQTQTWHFP
jgi:hypothetical protein